ncbi:hypothetical protein ML462_01005 [Gramella lutea]|uniref:DUF4136 domain-containing protein n=1 Tax=Christiangramia lutea TaxID=1607951 RepID=A0A9X1UZZ5_9FLAO|nr:hypothetical protein [Christiangramia lutea]MCH4821737.1 hypothetical protein [Christiangramia lutea]
MKKYFPLILLFFSISLLTSCSSVKVLNSWKANQETLNDFKDNKILVIARTADKSARIAFEQAIADKLRANGLDATESFSRVPVMHMEKEMTDERMDMIRTLMNSEGYNGVVLTVIKQDEKHTRTKHSGVYASAAYSNYYPGYYGNFYNYYATPYAIGPYYSAFGGYVPMSTSTESYSNYILETVAFNLQSEGDDQLVSVVSTSLKDPKDAYKSADEFMEAISKSLSL